jgi:hypothetical protein
MAAAERRLETDRARTAAETFGLPLDIDPHQALLDEVHRAAGVVAWIAVQVAHIDRDDVVWGTAKEISHDSDVDGTSGAVSTTEHRAGSNTWVKLYGEERDRLVRVAKAAIDAGVSERLVRIEERKGEMIAQLIADLIDDDSIGLDDGQRQAMRITAAKRLRALPAA